MIRPGLLLLLSLPCLAQEEADPLEGHSAHGGAFNEGPRQAAYLLDTQAAVHFPVTSGSAEVQAFVEQGVSFLHGFWYFEAERSFRHAAALDPDCAMAFWGMAMANVDNGDRAAEFARRAWLERERSTTRERMYIEAIARFHDVAGEDTPTRLQELDERACPGGPPLRVLPRQTRRGAASSAPRFGRRELHGACLRVAAQPAGNRNRPRHTPPGGPGSRGDSRTGRRS